MANESHQREMTKKRQRLIAFFFGPFFPYHSKNQPKTRRDYAQEEYARKSGFLKEWRQISRTRLKEVLLVLFVMLSCRWLAVSFTQPSLAIILIAVSFSSTAVGCAAVTYTQLHIVAGMDLAIDSFCIHFFKEMDRKGFFETFKSFGDFLCGDFFGRKEFEVPILVNSNDFTHECFFRSFFSNKKTANYVMVWC